MTLHIHWFFESVFRTHRLSLSSWALFALGNFWNLFGILELVQFYKDCVLIMWESSICDVIVNTLEKAMAPHSSTLAWKIRWMEEPDRLQSMGSRRVGHDWATSLSLFTFMHWRRKWQPTPGSCLENPRDRGAWWAAVYGVAQSWTRLKWLSSSSSKYIWKSPEL